ncbi:MAG: hypothetical protein AAFX50_24955, partial [Acidobacteriota bacterium]
MSAAADAVRREVTARAGQRALLGYAFFFSLLIVASFQSGGLFLFAAAVIATVYAGAAVMSSLGLRDLSV